MTAVYDLLRPINFTLGSTVAGKDVVITSSVSGENDDLSVAIRLSHLCVCVRPFHSTCQLASWSLGGGRRRGMPAAT